MALHVPVRVHVIRVVFLVARHLNLLEAPLGQDRVRRTEVAAERLVFETQARRERVNALDFVLRAKLDVVHDLDNPVVVIVADSRVSVARHLVLVLRHWRGYIVRVQVARCRHVVQPNHVPVLDES